MVEAGNFGTNDATGISLTASSDDAWVVSATGTIEYDDLAAGEDGAGEGLILIEIAPEAQHEWVLHLDLEFTTDGNTFNDDFAIEVQAAHFVFDRLLGGNNLDPGETANLRLEVMNVGGSDAPASTATIISLDPELGIVDETIQFDPMDIGEDDLSSIFEVAAHVMTIPGRVLRAMAIIVTQDGQVDTTYFSVPVGDKDSHDPMGPDSYGYHAFDDTDNGYELAPEYEWVEISSEAGNPDFDGIELQLSDNGDDQDDAVRIDLPFTIQYYGERFDEATVCSNGWIAMGNQADVGVSRNYAIPSGGGPNYMIAPYWDELFLNTGGVYSYYDEANGRFIVEWYHTTGYQGGGPNTFQVIFYTQDERPTFSEDNEFVFQYHTVNHVQGGQFNTSADTYWWTTGIENGNQTDGLQYSYWNTNGPGAAPITEERAILFSTNIYMITGTIQGNVTDLETGEPMEDALVSTDNYVYTTRTDAEGNYTLEEVMIGIDHIVVAERIGYNRTRTDFTVVSEDDTTIINFSLAHPEFGIDTNDLEFNMNAEDSQTQQITMSNSGNGDLEYSFRVLFTDPAQMNGYRGGDLETGELDDPWDPHFNFDLTDEETRNRAVTFYDGDFWVAGSVNNDIGDNKFYRYSKMANTLVNTFSQ